MLSITFRTLFFKEVLRFWKVATQTLTAPIITALLYMLIFGYALEKRISIYDGISYTLFLAPGLIMMSVLQNAFSNASSSLIQSKITGSLVFILLSPISALEFWMAYVLAAMVRGLLVGLGVFIVTLFFVTPPFAAPLWIIIFLFLGAAILGTIGLLAGIWADKYDQLASFQNFLIMPATFLAGVFYSIKALPPFWQHLSRFNPFFYMVDGFRYGFFGDSDINPFVSLTIVLFFFITLSLLTLKLLKSGYKLRQ